ncbi:MAG: DUF3194 domain-containing protein [Methanosphaera stadtmanae]|nr:DUF3194 domain-containing protein [Methanosphaera stadtmanae]
MEPLSNAEIDEIINLAYETSKKNILKHVNKKDFEDIEILINLDSHEDSFDIDIEIKLDTDFDLPDNLAENSVNKSIEAIDKYIENRNK